VHVWPFFSCDESNVQTANLEFGLLYALELNLAGSTILHRRKDRLPKEGGVLLAFPCNCRFYYEFNKKKRYNDV
jgi:hypothetical protein